MTGPRGGLDWHVTPTLTLALTDPPCVTGLEWTWTGRCNDLASQLQKKQQVVLSLTDAATSLQHEVAQLKQWVKLTD